jgi:hypothetical protein
MPGIPSASEAISRRRFKVKPRQKYETPSENN